MSLIVRCSPPLVLRCGYLKNFGGNTFYLRPNIYAALQKTAFFSNTYAPIAAYRRNRPEYCDIPTGLAQIEDSADGVPTAYTLAKQQRLCQMLGETSSSSSAYGGTTQELFQGRVIRRLSCRRKKWGGRNCTGQITVRHRGGGHIQRLRFVDFKRSRKDIFASVLRIEYDPSRSAHIALIQYDDGVLSYILAPVTLRPGDQVIASENAPIAPGNALPFNRIPNGSIVHCIELTEGHGGKIARAAGAYATLLTKEKGGATLRLPSGETRRVPLHAWATIGQIGNVQLKRKSLGKAGARRWRGWRPAVRGKAMNPCKHPHGGGTSQKGTKRNPVSAWGILRTGYKTRDKKKPLGGIIRRKLCNRMAKRLGGAAG